MAIYYVGHIALELYRITRYLWNNGIYNSGQWFTAMSSTVAPSGEYYWSNQYQQHHHAFTRAWTVRCDDDHHTVTLLCSLPGLSECLSSTGWCPITDLLDPRASGASRSKKTSWGSKVHILQICSKYCGSLLNFVKVKVGLNLIIFLLK